ncbi:hypothetical protein FMM68_03860 [Lachnospiraceae bacterium MD329]|nr:hypothetical protein [Lachnospiraceae bacterium MD329]
MTEDFAKTVNRLSRARNFEDGAFCLITAHANENTHTVEQKNINSGVLNGINNAVKNYMDKLDNNAARTFRNMLKETIIKDEERRFQIKDMKG